MTQGGARATLYMGVVMAGLAVAPANAQTLWPNLVGWFQSSGGPSAPPPTCGNLLDFSDSCNSQYVASGMQ